MNTLDRYAAHEDMPADEICAKHADKERKKRKKAKKQAKKFKQKCAAERRKRKQREKVCAERELRCRAEANLQATKLLLTILLNTAANPESSSLRSLVEKSPILNGDFREIDS